MLQTGRHARLCAARTLIAAAGLVALTATSLSAPASAETLRDALAAAYQYNPQIDAERARLRATDEGVSQANAAFRPSINAGASSAFQNTETKPTSLQEGRLYPKQWNVTVNQPIFRGFRSINGVNVAEANVRAGRETLRNTEQVVLLGVVTSYMDVIRDQAILKLRENNQRVLADTLKSTREQFAVGEVTRTDVAQAEASLAGAGSAIELARANLKASRATFERFVGRPPGTLAEPRGLGKMIPSSLQSAIAISQQETPSVVAALYQEQAARWNVDLVRGELLPTVSLQGQYVENIDASRQLDESRVTTVTGQVQIPIYDQGGAVYSRVREAKHRHVATLQEIQRAKNDAQSTVVAAWSQLQASRAQIQSDQAAVEANRVALNGVREEEKVGQRTKLDVLDAEQAFLNSQVNLVSTKRNLIVNDYTVLQAIGRLNMQELAAVAEVYDPTVHYQEVRRKWWGIDITHADGRYERHDLWDTHGERHKPVK
ncbi:MAG: TolC family outer membrane protein [Hyphomicrobiaceae bacterium]|nr:TolC family outer membrane protein [Hyphomicrobiaceae bacterium]